MARFLGGDPQIARCIAGSFLLRAAAAGAAAMISFFIADMEHLHPGAVRGSLVIGLATVLFFGSEIVGAIVFGALTDKHGERLYMRLGPGFGAISAIAMALGASIAGVVLARVLQGLSTAAAIPASLAVLSRQAGDGEARRGKVMSFFEISAIGGMAAGIVGAGELWDAIGPHGFWVMLGLYAISLGILWPVGRAQGRGMASHSDHGLRFLKSPRALRLVPAWVAVNGVLGVWLTHAAHQLKKADDPTQLLVGGFTGSEISRFGGITLVLFVVGIGVWGMIMGRIGSVRTMMLSLAGLVALCPALFLLNHSQGRGELRVGVLIVAAGAALLVTSGFTPAALAYLSKIAEEFAEQRGAIMGLYSVLLGVGQALGGALGGIGADWRGADGLIAASILFTACAIVAVAGLARTERALGMQADAHRRLVEEPVGLSRH